MAKNPKAAFEKRQKEIKRQKKQKVKAEKLQARKEQKAQGNTQPAGEDPDLAGLVVGPNPPPPEAA